MPDETFYRRENEVEDNLPFYPLECGKDLKYGTKIFELPQELKKPCYSDIELPVCLFLFCFILI